MIVKMPLQPVCGVLKKKVDKNSRCWVRLTFPHCKEIPGIKVTVNVREYFLSFFKTE